MNDNWNQVRLARAIAIAAHAGQLYGIMPYIMHPEGVSVIVHRNKGDWMHVAAAWLHDVVEDTKITFHDLASAGIDFRVINLVRLLTRNNGETYEEYIKRLAADESAILIKLADLEYNLAHSPTDRQRLRYETAKDFLENYGL